MSAMEPIDTHDLPLSHEPIETWQDLPAAASAGPRDDEGGRTATTGFAELGTIGGADFGLWEMSAGAMRDVEGDEVFLVISGTGRIEFDEPRREPIHLAPGSLVRLDEGMTTRWYVDEAPLRKLFIAPHEG
ncbi:cupin domain-containing protein [Brevibacterium sp. FAM 27836]|uniref:cupin domain-containing protein n=1 Tax=Brevibacterium sp. FAM 27836 TaxID=3446693 RepID=UPI003F516CB5